MENKLYSKDCITLDGRMDEMVWETAKEYSGFKFLKRETKKLDVKQTVFKLLPCEDRVYIGIKCFEPDMEETLRMYPIRSIWGADCVEIYFSPDGNEFEYYQFAVTLGGKSINNFWSEGGATRPDPYAPDWNYAVYVGEDYWSVEAEFPLTAFYMTPNAVWSDKWTMNVARTFFDYSTGKERGQLCFSAWGDNDMGYAEPKAFRRLENCPVRPAADDIYISSVKLDIRNMTDKGYEGMITVKSNHPEAADFVLCSECMADTPVSAAKGLNEYSAPCFFAEGGRQQVPVALKRVSDGKVFKRYYPVRVEFVPITVKFTLPEYRTNFYPGQDTSKIAGTVIANRPVTLTLEGPGIEKTTVIPNADGSFCFETPNFQIGDAYLTAKTETDELVKRIRNLPPTGRQMSWISGGNLIVNGEPVLRRNMYAQYYAGGTAFKRRYDADELHITKQIRSQTPMMEPGRLIKGSESPTGEVMQDAPPSEEMKRKIDEVMENNKDRDFTYYYICDEPECRGVSPIYLRHYYEYIAEKDPYHVICMAVRGADQYVECADWFETHPYINPQNHPERGRIFGRPITSMGRFMDDILKLNRSDKCMGFLPTCFAYNGSNKYSDYPTFDEYICHIWAAMIHGGKTLFPYAYLGMNDRASIYEGTRYVFSSFDALEKLVLLGKRTELYNANDVHCVLYGHNDEKMFVLVNMVLEPRTVTVDGLSGQWHNFRHGGMITGNTFELKPLEVVIGTNKVMDEGLPTYQATAALIDKLEYERTHRGSLLFERHHDIEVTSSKRVNAYKPNLFDGVRDNYGWELKGEGEKFLELDLTKIKPTVSKIGVYGMNVDDVAIKVTSNGEMFAPAVSMVQTEEFSTVLQLAEPVTADKLRLVFNQDVVELYEIEAF